MNLLLTSGGLTTPTLVAELRSMLDKPTTELNLVVIPTAHNPDSEDKSWVLEEVLLLPHQMGWKTFKIIDLAAVSSLEKHLWWSQLEEADVILVGGGSVFYLSYWMQQAGLFEVLPEWLKSKTYVGISAGSQILGTDLYASVEVMEREGHFNDEDYDEIGPKGQSSSKTLQLVDFTFRPHLNSPLFPKIREPYLQQVAKTLDHPMYALDDSCAICVTDDGMRVVGDGEWLLLQ